MAIVNANRFAQRKEQTVRRGDIFYVDFGSIKDAVGFEFAKKRPVLIIQNDIGNKNSGTTIGLCLSSKCKPELPVRFQYDNLSVIRRPSDICAEQIKTIDKCRLEEYMGNVGPEVMKEVDRVVAFSLGMKETNDTEEFKSFQTTNNGTENMIQEQLAFWQNITFRITILESEKKKLDEEIESVLFYIEDSTYNAAQGYKVYKVLKDIRNERKKIVAELTYLQALNEQLQPEKMIAALSKALTQSSEEINHKGKLRLVEEIMGQAI